MYFLSSGVKGLNTVSLPYHVILQMTKLKYLQNIIEKDYNQWQNQFDF